MNQLVRRPCRLYLRGASYLLRHHDSILQRASTSGTQVTRHHLSSDTDFKPSEELAKERYDVRANEDIEKKRARLLYQSRKRGMLENGVILASFANKFLDQFNAEQLDQYDRLINLPTNDWDIFYWATKTKPTPVEFETPIMAKLREHLHSKVSNENSSESVLGKTRPDDIVMPTIKNEHDLQVDVSQVSLTDFKEQLFDDRKKTFRDGKSIVLMTQWRKKFFEQRLRRTLSSPTSMKSLADEKEDNLYTQKLERKDIASETIASKDMVDSPYERNIKHHNFLQHLLGSELTDDAVDYDDEAEAWSDMLWHRNYGTSDDNIAPVDTKCFHCRANLHCCDPGLNGFMPKESLATLMSRMQNSESGLERVLCQLCNFSKVYKPTKLSHEMSKRDYVKFLRSLATKNSSVICLLVDLTDLPGSIWRGAIDLIGTKHRVLVVGNKLDLLPYDGHNMIERVKFSLSRNISKLRPGETNLNVRDVMVLSARTGFGVEGLVTRLLDLTNSCRDVYLIGNDNTGKSTLFSALLQSDLCAQRKGDILSRVSAYSIQDTDLKMLRFPIYNADSWEVEMKIRRTERVERDTALRERSLGNTSKMRQASMPHMSTLINRLEYLPTTTSSKPEVITSSSPETTDVAPMAANAVERFTDEESRLPRFTDDHPLNQLDLGEPLSADETKFEHNKFFHQTPSCFHYDQIHSLLTTNERIEVFPNETIIPRKYSVRPLQTIFIAGLARLDLLTSQQNVLFTFFISRYLPIHVIPTRKADQFYAQFLGTPYLGVPFATDDNPNRLATWPELTNSKSDYHIRGVAQHVGSADIVFSSIGWALVNLIKDQECLVRVFTPEGRGIYLRKPPLLAYANRPLGKKIRDTPMFQHPHYVIEKRSESNMEQC